MRNRRKYEGVFLRTCDLKDRKGKYLCLAANGLKCLQIRPLARFINNEAAMEFLEYLEKATSMTVSDEDTGLVKVNEVLGTCQL